MWQNASSLQAELDRSQPKSPSSTHPQLVAHIFFWSSGGKNHPALCCADQRCPACCEATVVSHADKQKVKWRAGNTVSHFWCSCGTSLQKWPNSTFHKVVDKFDLKKRKTTILHRSSKISTLYTTTGQLASQREGRKPFCADCFFPRTRLPPTSQRHVHVGQNWEHWIGRSGLVFDAFTPRQLRLAPHNTELRGSRDGKCLDGWMVEI